MCWRMNSAENGVKNMNVPSDAGKPKAAPVAGVVLTALAVVLIAGLLTFAGPCDPQAVHGGGEVPSCFWAFRAMLGAGVILMIISIVRIFETDEGERRGLSLGAALLGALIAATPGLLVALCGDASMPCNAVMRPFAMLLGSTVFLVGAIDLTLRLIAVFRH